MSRKLFIAGMVYMLVVLTAGLLAVSASSAAPQPKTLRYLVVQRAATYDVVRSSNSTLRITHRQRYVTLQGAARYRVVKRSAPFTVDRPAADAASAGEDRPQAAAAVAKSGRDRGSGGVTGHEGIGPRDPAAAAPDVR